MNFNDVLRGFLITFEHERRPFTMSLFQNLEMREPSSNDEGKRAGRERGEKKGKTRGEQAASRSHPFPKMGLKLAGGFFSQ